MKDIFIFIDFDGTITTRDTGVVLIDSSFGKKERQKLDSEILAGTIEFRSAVKSMWKSYSKPVDEALEQLKDIVLTPDFKEFYDYSMTSKIPLTVLSAGLEPLVSPFLDKLLFVDGRVRHDQLFSVLANGLDIDTKDNSWNIIYRDSTHYGHDKGQALRNLRALHGPDAYLIFIGDGVSDLSAAREADTVFAKQGLDLENWCVKEGIAVTPFTQFGTIIDFLTGLELP